ncbi:hypothetical protein ACRAWF_19780 [Streptomyces sp. L7]
MRAASRAAPWAAGGPEVSARWTKPGCSVTRGHLPCGPHLLLGHCRELAGGPRLLLGHCGHLPCRPGLLLGHHGHLPGGPRVSPARTRPSPGRPGGARRRGLGARCADGREQVQARGERASKAGCRCGRELPGRCHDARGRHLRRPGAGGIGGRSRTVAGGVCGLHLGPGSFICAIWAI